jgi:hypothetical protein
LQLTVSQSVRLGVEPDFGTFDQRYFFFFFFFGKVTVLSFRGALSDERTLIAGVWRYKLALAIGPN